VRQGFPEELPHCDLSKDVLGGLSQFLDIIPNFAGSESTQSASPTPLEPLAVPGSAGPFTSAALEADPFNTPSSSRLKAQNVRRQMHNRVAQQRFRQRQKVSALAIVVGVVYDACWVEFPLYLSHGKSTYASTTAAEYACIVPVILVTTSAVCTLSNL